MKEEGIPYKNGTLPNIVTLLFNFESVFPGSQYNHMVYCPPLSIMGLTPAYSTVDRIFTFIVNNMKIRILI